MCFSCVRTPALAGHPGPILVKYAGETGKLCRDFPGASPACRGTPETPADNAGCSVLANRSVFTVDSHGCSVRANRSVYIVDASGCSVWKQPSCVRGRKEFGLCENRSVCTERRLFPGR